jgi:hypothetical protein
MAAPSLAIKCYSGSTGAVIKTEIDIPGDHVCVRYSFKCTANDNGCTPAEQTAGTTKTSFTTVASSTADQMKLSPSVYVNLLVCKTDYCNSENASNSAVKSADVAWPLIGLAAACAYAL